MRSGLLEEVGEVMRVVATEVIVPRFCALSADEVAEKAPGELVTVADREAEQLLSESLHELLPSAQVVGEERVASRPELLAGLDQGEVWLIDPLDGTRNFVAGHACFAVMVALLREGEAVASWLLDPMTNQLARAELGAGAFLEGARLRTDEGSPGVEQLRGAVLTKYMPEPLRRQVEQRTARMGEALPGTRCAGAEYPAIASGRQDLAVFWRTLPWDHAPGALLLSEAGGVVARCDGTPYRASDARTGLLAARNRAIWDDAQQALFADEAAACR